MTVCSFFLPITVLETNNEQIERITLFNHNAVWQEIKFSRFAEKLPKNLSFDDNRVNVVRKWGRVTELHENMMTYLFQEVEVNLYFAKNIQKIVINARRCLTGNCKDGYGVFLSRTGDRYEGHWKNKTKWGKGVCYYANGDKYEGNWQQDKPEGQGKMTYKNGTIKQGVWENGNFKGELNLRNNLLVELLGKHKTDSKVLLLLDYYDKSYDIILQPFDYQQYTLHNHKLTLYFDEYGFVQQVEVNKSGLQTYFPTLYAYLQHHHDEKHLLNLFGEPDKRTEKTDSLHKIPIWIYKDSSLVQEIHFTPKKHFHNLVLVLAHPYSVLQQKPVGQCLKGECKQGYGEMKAQFGIYKGHFHRQYFSGKGRLSYTNGGYYRGWFRHNQLQGYGYRQWTDRSNYIGNWKNNLFNGRGTMNYANKDRYEGNWKNGKRQGYGKMRYANGEIYMGYWKENQRNGKAVWQQKNGKKKIGYWENDRQQ
jgi:hypothetical protein